ncbi:MAG: dihydrofolate reductase family protein [Propionibacteriaceae bacterium]
MSTARLIYSMLVSLDGYSADQSGGFGWAQPATDVHAHVNELARSVGTSLYGRRMYATMAGWETDPGLAASSPLLADFAQLWQAADKIVYSTSLTDVVTARTRIERSFDVAADRELKTAAAADLNVSGPELAAHALRAGLVDELQVYVVPVVVGGGTAYLPTDVRLDLELIDERRFADGTVFLRYRVRP